MMEVQRLREYAASCLSLASGMSQKADAARLREMAADALDKAARLEAWLDRHPQPPEKKPN